MDWLSGRLRCEQRSGRAPLTRLVLAIYADRYAAPRSAGAAGSSVDRSVTASPAPPDLRLPGHSRVSPAEDVAPISMAVMVRFLVLYDKPQDAAAFDRHYREVHVPMAEKLPGLRRYTVSHNPAPIRVSAGDGTWSWVGARCESFPQRRHVRCRPQRRVDLEDGVIADGELLSEQQMMRSYLGRHPPAL